MSVIELESLLGQALTYADDGDWQSAMEFLRRHLEDFEQEAAVHCALGVAERELGHEGIAYELFKKTLSLEPEDPYVMPGRDLDGLCDHVVDRRRTQDDPRVACSDRRAHREAVVVDAGFHLDRPTRSPERQRRSERQRLRARVPGCRIPQHR